MSNIRTTLRWRELLETGPEFHGPDRMMADEPFNIGRSDRDRNGNTCIFVGLLLNISLLIVN